MQNMNNLPQSFTPIEPQFQSQTIGQNPLNATELFTQLANQTPEPVCLAKGECEYRFANVNCPADTAVTVQLGHETHYLHANTVKTPDGSTFIAAQAPHTDFSRELYLKTVLEKASVIVDLTNEADNKVGSPTVDGHYPKEIGEQQTFSSITITLKDKKVDNDSLIHILRYHISDATTGQEREITRINYQGWKDFQGSELGELAKLISVVNQHKNESEHPNLSPMVNCRAGVGRTGTFITAATMYNLASQGNLGNDRVGVLSSTILEARGQRGPLFVQTDAQLATLIEFTSQLENQSAVSELPKTALEQPNPPIPQFASLNSLEEPKFTPPAVSPFRQAWPSEQLAMKNDLPSRETQMVAIPTSTQTGTPQKVTHATFAMLRRPDIFMKFSLIDEQSQNGQSNTLGVQAVRRHNVNILGITAARPENRVHLSPAKKPPEMPEQTDVRQLETNAAKKAKSSSLFAKLKRTATRISNFLFGK